MKNKPIILCVDDEKIVLRTLKDQIKSVFKEQCSIESADSGESALSLFNELVEEGNSVAVVVSDYLMADMTGDVLLEKIHCSSPETLTVLLTGHEDFKIISNAVNKSNLYRYIHKPWDKEEVILTVKEALKKFLLGKSLLEKNIELETANKALDHLNKELIEKIKLFHRFVPSQFLEAITPGAKEYHINLGVNAERDIAIMFIDIRSFTAMSSKLTSEETFEFINEFIREKAPIISKHSGFIDKFLGDGIMAIFTNCNQALQAGIEILDSTKVSNVNRKAAGKSEINVGIALNCGLVRMGTVGYEERMETTVIGKVINVCAKIEKMNKIHHTEILMTDNLVKKLELRENFPLKLVGETYLEGMETPIILWTVSFS
jgi:adenylate cyclase